MVFKVMSFQNILFLKNRMVSNYVRSIIQDSKQNYWIGTYEGLNKMVRDSSSGSISFKTYNKKEGLPL